jgi:hypothetical protein
MRVWGMHERILITLNVLGRTSLEAVVLYAAVDILEGEGRWPMHEAPSPSGVDPLPQVIDVRTPAKLAVEVTIDN